jgi:CHAT domain-containing protein
LGNPLYYVKEEDPAVAMPSKSEKSGNLKEDDTSADKKKKAEKAKLKEIADKIAPPGYLALATNLAWGPISREVAGSQGILYPPLPATEPEILAIANIFEVSAEPPDVLLGRQANKIQLQQAIKDCRYLHFATHTELTDKIQGRLEPFILLGQSDNDVLDECFLNLSEVLDLDLDTEMVVLANCHAGRGQAMMGQGVINMARAFLYAGARSTLINLWDIKPEVAKEFFTKFYGYLKEGKSRSESLRLARMDIRMTHPNPVFWAGFLLYGEG